MNSSENLQRTALFDLHREASAKIVPFAGYEMPVNYPDGIIKEHLHTRAAAGLFDVSHMGQISVRDKDGCVERTADALETLMPVDLVALPRQRQKYALLTNDDGGIIDDLMVQNLGEHFNLVVNAACKANDFAHLQQHLAPTQQLALADDLALLALQGPAAATVLTNLGCDIGHDLGEMKFMGVRELNIDGVACIASRSGYTGEDGFELSMAAAHAVQVARRLLADAAVKWVGLGARDSLRLEAGLCLYGHDITTATTPIEGNLLWAVSKARRRGGERAGGFPGDDIILPQIPNHSARRRVGLLPDGRAPIREGAELFASDGGDDHVESVGMVTSGGFSPSLGKPICMGYVALAHAALGTALQARVRGRLLPVTVAKLPFVAPNFYR
ncbi:glycine cleavage system aminomethyltransferase GcvT [Candidatus Spongiihabitans sp.]|uniref:glycine cleavage system aminomethyltransferase GcvT n=1 Tax=Candidatus Spongiihabitans sp. TaxID=3101308 RepID=UPI003C7CE0C6